MDKMPTAILVGSLIGNPVSDENGASLGWIEELVNDPDSGRARIVVRSVGDIPASGNAACAIPRESLRLDSNCTSTEDASLKPEDESKAGKPKPESACSVYTYSVNRHR